MRSPLLLLLLPLLWLGCKPPDDRAALIGGMRNVAKLATLEVQMNKIVFGEKNKRLLFMQLPSATHIARTTATIKLGIDFNKIRPGDIQAEGDRIDVRLPPIEVVDFIYQPSSFEVREDLSQNNMFTRIAVGEIEEMYQKSELEIREMIQFTDLEEMGQDQTAALFRFYLQRVGFREIYVSFKDRTSPIHAF